MKIPMPFVISSLLAQIALSDITEPSLKSGEIPWHGNGEHNVRSKPEYKDNQIIALTKLAKGKSIFELTKSSKHDYSVIETSDENRKRVMQFKLGKISDVYLVDIVFINKSTALIALTNLPYGYQFIKFKIENEKFTPYLYSKVNMIPELQDSNSKSIKIVGFDESGKFITKMKNGQEHVYSIQDDKQFIYRNNEVFEYSSVKKYEDMLPNSLRQSDKR